MSAWESTRTPSLRKSASCSIIALRNNSESPILSSSATVHSPSVDWSLLKEPHGGRLRQRPLPFTHSRGHYPRKGLQKAADPVARPGGRGVGHRLQRVGRGFGRQAAHARLYRLGRARGGLYPDEGLARRETRL